MKEQAQCNLCGKCNAVTCQWPPLPSPAIPVKKLENYEYNQKLLEESKEVLKINTQMMKQNVEYVIYEINTLKNILYFIVNIKVIMEINIVFRSFSHKAVWWKYNAAITFPVQSTKQYPLKEEE